MFSNNPPFQAAAGLAVLFTAHVAHVELHPYMPPQAARGVGKRQKGTPRRKKADSMTRPRETIKEIVRGVNMNGDAGEQSRAKPGARAFPRVGDPRCGTARWNATSTTSNAGATRRGACSSF